MYSDEKIKEEKLIEYTQGLTRELKRTSFIKLFAENLRNYMPKYNELKHFNANKVATAFLYDNGLKLNTATMTTIGDQTMWWKYYKLNFEKSIVNLLFYPILK